MKSSQVLRILATEPPIHVTYLCLRLHMMFNAKQIPYEQYRDIVARIRSIIKAPTYEGYLRNLLIEEGKVLDIFRTEDFLRESRRQFCLFLANIYEQEGD